MGQPKTGIPEMGQPKLGIPEMGQPKTTDQRFQALVSESVQNWLPAKEMMPLLEWWDCLKVEVKAAAKTVTRDRRNERKQELAFLMTLQAHLAAKVSGGDLQSFADLKHAQE